MVKSNGDKFEAKFRLILNDIKCFNCKYPDFKTFIRRSGKSQRANVPEALCDRLVFYKGRGFLFELKHRDKEYFYFDGRALRQLGRLMLAYDQGGAFGFFVFEIPSGMYIVFCKTLCVYLRRNDKKSLNSAEIIDLGHVVKSCADLERIMRKFIDRKILDF